MKDIAGNVFIKNNVPNPIANFDLGKSEGVIIYEVIRIIDNKILFFPQHLERFRKSLSGFGYPDIISSAQVEAQIKLLHGNNTIDNGNVKFLLKFSETIDFYAFFIPHKYPSLQEYKNGITLETLVADRPNPNIKQQHQKLSELVSSKINKTKVYEILLVHPDGLITEGSKSNFFLIKGNQIHTAPERDILAGITRKFILQLCVKRNIPVIENEIPVDGLEKYDAAFISGTSPKILPVSRIDDLYFNVDNSLLRELMCGFEEIITENLFEFEKI